MPNIKILKDSKFKNIKFEILLPIIFILAINFISILCLEVCIIFFLCSPVIIVSSYLWFLNKSSRTNIFFVFSIFSGIYLLCLFEFFVPLLELLPQENFLFILLIFLTTFFFYKTYQHSLLNRLGSLDSAKDDDDKNDSLTVNLISESDEDSEAGDRKSCQTCRKFIPARTFHCNVCKNCIIGRDHHNYFLNCCIGRFNHKYFLFGCLCCFFSLVLFANLALTSVCHPFPIFKIFGVMVLLPDDCQDVFVETEIAICFVGAIYALELAVLLVCVMIHQFVLISKGTTSTEYWLYREKSATRKYGCYRNWKNFCYI